MAGPTTGEVTVHIAASPQHVYDLVSDVTRMGEWSPETYECRWVDGATGPAVGARFLARNRRGAMRWSNRPVVTAATPAREFAFRRSAAGSEVQWRYRIEPDADGTRVTESYEVIKASPGPLTWLVTKLLRVRDRDVDLRQGMQETLERLGAVACRPG